jgi:hypothetical protein
MANAKKRYPAIVPSEVEGLEIRGVVIHILINPENAHCDDCAR